MKKYFSLILTLMVLSIVLMALRLFLLSEITVLFCVITLFISYKKLAVELKDVETRIRKVINGEQLDKFILQENDELVFIKEWLNNLFDVVEPLILSKEDVKGRVRSIIDVIDSPVILMSYSGRIVLYNKAAKIFIRGNCRSCFYFEMLRNMALIDVVGHCLNSDLENEEVKIGESIYRINSFRRVNFTGEKLILCVFTDITLSKKKDSFEREFISAVSHELKTPLSVIRGAIDILGEEDISPNERKKFVQLIKNNSGRMNNLIKKLLVLTEIRSGGRINKKRVNLKECVESVLKTELPTANQKNISVKIKLEDAWTIGDGFLLTEMIRNIVSNAIKYTERGGCVEISVVKNFFAMITVKDNGPGISKELLPNIFKPFYRADSSRARVSGGTGLGLTIAKRIALLHKGNITVKSGTGKGAQFVIQLPIV